MKLYKSICVFCGRRAIGGWLDLEDHFTPVCRGHQWIAVAACGSAQAEYISLERTKKPAPESGSTLNNA